MDDQIYKAGEKCVTSGQYVIVNAKGESVGIERTMVKNNTFPPPPDKNHGYQLVDPTKTSKTMMINRKSTKQVNIIVIYYLIVQFTSFWLLLDIWGSKFTVMRLIGLGNEALSDPLLRTIGFTIVGGIIGSLLYHIRVLYFYYANKKSFDPMWFGKYITAPWEGAGMALVVLSLIRGGVAVFGGSMGTDVTGASNFAAFGTGALVGFGMRDVVGWIGTLIHTMFRIERPKDTSPLTHSPLKNKKTSNSEDEK